MKPTPPDTLGAMLDRAAGFPEAGLRLLDRDEREQWRSWAEIRDRALEVSGGLQALGVAPGERVALVFPTGWGFFDAFFGALYAGAVPVPLYPPVRLGRLAEYHRQSARMLEAAAAVVVLADARVKRILGRTVRDARPLHGCRTLGELDAVDRRPIPVHSGDLALVQYSSGTTVDPKPVALSHRAVIAQTVALNHFWPDDGVVRHGGVSWLPLYHDMGLIGCIFPALERPGPLTLIPPEHFVARPSLWLRAISRERATVSPAPNFAYGLCVDKIDDSELDGVDLSCWQVALNGAEAVAPQVLRAFAERFARWGFRREALTPVYGLSEAALAVTFSDLGEPFQTRTFDRESLSRGRASEAAGGRELVSVGRPLQGFAVQVRDANGVELPDGAVGEVMVQGPSLMEGYLGQPEATARVLRNGWLATGDLGFMLDGELYLTGRAKDVLILRGLNHAPEEVEQAVDTIEGVRTGCAVAVSWLPEGADGEVLLVFVETRKGTRASEFDAVADGCRRAILAATGLAAESVVVLPPGTLPRTSSGKRRRRETLARYLAGELTPPHSVSAPRMAGALVGSAIAFARSRWERRE